MTDAAPATALPKKSSLGRKIYRLFLYLVLIILVGLIVLYFTRNYLVKMGVTRGGNVATEQVTSLAIANLSLGGSLNLGGLEIDNIKGKAYKAPKILVMKRCDVAVQPMSLFSHTVQVDTIIIEGLEFTLEQDGINTNLGDLLAIIQKNTAATTKTESKAPGKELKIGLVQLIGTKVHVRTALGNTDFNLPNIEMTNPTNPDGRPMKIADLVGKIVVHIGKQIIDSKQLPPGVKDAMKNVDTLLNSVPDLTKDLKLPALKVPDLGKDAGKTLDKLNPFEKKD